MSEHPSGRDSISVAQKVKLMKTMRTRGLFAAAPDFSKLLETNIDPALTDGETPSADGDVAVATRPLRAARPGIDPKDPSTWGRTARNAPCPCGSGKKFKHCHGRV